MDVFELVAKLRLDSSEYEAGVKNAKDSGEKLSKASKGLKALDNGVNKILKVGAVAATAAAAGMTAFAKSAVDTGMGFDAAMSQVAATLGTTVDQIGELRAKAQEMGASTVYSAKEAAEGLNILAMSGYDADQSIGMIEDVLHLAAAGGMDMASAAGFISGAMKGFADDTKDAGYYADLMAKGATLANTSVSQLGDALSSGAAVAASYGQSAETTTIALLRLAEQGEAGSAAGTALAAAMKNLYAPTDQAAKKMAELGVNAFDTTTGKARDFNTVVNELQASMAGMTDQERTANAQLIFGIQGFNAYNKMVVTGTERQAEWAEALAHASDAGGEAARQYATMTDNLQGDMTALSSATEGVKIAFSEGVTPAIRETVQQLTKMLQKKSTQDFMRKLGQQAGDLAKTLTGKLGNALPRIMTLFEDGGKKIKIAGAAFATFVIAVKAAVNPIGAAASAIGLLGAAFGISALTADSAAKKYSVLTDEQRSNIEAVRDGAATYGDMIDARNEAMAGIDQEAEKARGLWEELQGLVDGNGKVKEGNLDRAQAITELLQQMGYEISMTGDAIDSYNSLVDSMDKVIEKKRAMRMIEAGEAAYDEAAKGLQATREAIYDAGVEIDNYGAKIAEKQAELANLPAPEWQINPEDSTRYAELTAEIKSMQAAQSDLQASIAEGQALETSYIQTMATQEKALALAREENWSGIIDLYTQDATARAQHLAETGRLTAEDIAQLQHSYDVAANAAKRYEENLSKGTEGYSQEELARLQAQVDEIGKVLESAKEPAADAGTAVTGEFSGAISDGAGEAGSAGDGVGSATVRGMNKEGDAYNQGANNVRAYNRGVQSVPVATIGEGGTSHAIGNDYVPYNNYPALLHRGEAVLTAREADEWRRGQAGGGDGGFTLIQNIETVPQTPVELAAASAAFLEQARWAV